MVSTEQLVLRPLKTARGAVDGVLVTVRRIGGLAKLFALDSAGKEYLLTGGDIENQHTTSEALDLSGLETLNQTGSPLVMTLADPGVPGLRLSIVQIDGGTQGHTVTTASAGGFDGTNNTATFNAAFETLDLLSVSGTRWVILSNVGAVGLSSV